MTDWTIDKVRVYPQRAIDEIERLREALEKIANSVNPEYGYGMIETARAALSENAEA